METEEKRNEAEHEFIMNFYKMFNEKYPDGIEPRIYINSMIKILIVFARQHKIKAYPLIYPILKAYYDKAPLLKKKEEEK